MLPAKPQLLRLLLRNPPVEPVLVIVPPIGVLTDPVCDVRVRHGRFLLLKGFDLELVVGPLFCLFTEAGKASCFGFHSGWSEATILQIVQRHGSRDLREGLSPNRPAVIASCCWRLELRYQFDENCDQSRNHTSLVLVFTISSRRLVGTSLSHKQPDSIHIHGSRSTAHDFTINENFS